jgi:multiple sugar transport system permease protein
MMSPILFYSLILGVVEVLQYFLVPLVLKNGTGEPSGQTFFYNLNLYKTFFTYQELSYGATMAWLLFIVTLVITLILFALSRRWVYYAGER